MKVTPDNEKILELVNWARKGKLVLPQFQRNFVWEREDITELILSILQGHYIGSFLFLSVDKDNIPFAYRLLEGINNHHIGGYKPEYMILDGQQRLTSLNYAFSAPNIPLRGTKYPYRFFLQLDKVVEEDWENAILSERANNGEKFLETQYQYANRILPLTAIEHEEWNRWFNGYERWLMETNKDFYLTEYFNNLRPKWQAIISQVQSFFVPVLVIPKISGSDNQSSLAEICAIFEKINSMGVRLSVYDLLTARLYKYEIDLHKLWQEAVKNHKWLNEYSEGKPDEFGVFVLRTIALIRGLEVKGKSLINLSPTDFKKDWQLAVRYIDKALERMTSTGVDGFGAFKSKWVPYLTMVSPLAAMLATTDSRKFGHKAYQLIRRWYWSAVFGERYAFSVESNIHRDYQDFLKAMQNSDNEPHAIQEARSGILENQGFSLRNINRLNSVYKGIMCLIALNGARDFCSGDSIQFHDLEDHHIFPDGYLKKQTGKDGQKHEPNQINCVINRTLISEGTNRKIQDKSPSEYVDRYMAIDHREEILRTHFITPAAIQAMLDNDFEKFVEEREKALIQEIRKRITES